MDSRRAISSDEFCTQGFKNGSKGWFPAIQVPKICSMTMHTWAVRLCGLVYFIAFLGNVIDGPVMWMLLPPTGNSHAHQLLMRNRIGCLAALAVFFRPRWWVLLLVCWPLWYETSEYGGRWFHFGWDEMMNEVGFLCILLSITLTLYDDVISEAEAQSVESGRLQETCNEPGASGEDETLLHRDIAESASGDTLHARKGVAASSSSSAAPGSRSSGSASVSRSDSGLCPDAAKKVRRASSWWWPVLWGLQEPVPAAQLQPAGPLVCLARDAVEISITLVAFRLFVAAGLLKMRRGSVCWRDHTCLYDHFETQPMPNPVAWYVNAIAPHWALRLMQWFSIDVAEVVVPWFFLGFCFTMGPMGILHQHLQTSIRNPIAANILAFPARFVAACLTLTFLIGMFSSGNYAFLHILSAVPLLVCLATVRRTPAIRVTSEATMLNSMSTAYHLMAPLAVVALCIFAFLPSLQAYAWIATGTEFGWPSIGPLMSTSVVQQASSLHVGIPYNRHAYFAGAVHSRNEIVLFGDFGQGWVELDIPYKVGREDRRPRQTSPLHRRFAWQWWFLELGDDPEWLFDFMRHLCVGTKVAWNAIESPLPDGVDPDKMKRVSIKAFNFHFTLPGEDAWWPQKWWSRKEAEGLTPPFEMSCK
mmetsp:Transcript_34816/g.81286  ORF Transcript_34816/g.81286 Transcript_34816/m.81286 type:complete len:645 (-) Transcript_34816:91-2025(-)